MRDIRHWLIQQFALDEYSCIDAPNPRLASDEIKAKRAILQIHALHKMDACRVCHAREISQGWSTRRWNYPCDTVKLLALPYADREGYLEEWRIIA